MTDGRVFARLGAAGLLTFCQCSLFFDVEALDDGGLGASRPDATSGAEGATGNDGAVEAGDEASPPNEEGDDGGDLEAAGDDGTVDAPAVGDDETGTPNVMGDEESLDAPDGAVLDGGDASGESSADTGPTDGPVDSAGDMGAPDAPPDSGDFAAMGLVAFYPFDELSGSTSADASGNGQTATMQGATFAAGVQGNAANMNGNNQYVVLPTGIVSGLASFSISAWFYLNDTLLNSRIFDFGTGTTTYMFLTPEQMRFSITTSGANGEQSLIGPQGVATASWQHFAVTLAGATCTLYFNGAAFPTKVAVTLKPSSLGSTTQNWLGRSQFPTDPYLNGKIDNFRIYNRALSPAEIQQLYTTKR